MAISVDQLAHLVLLVGIEAVGRLVHDQHLRVVQDRLGDGDAPLEALRQRLDPLLQHRVELRPSPPPLATRLSASCAIEAADLAR